MTRANGRDWSPSGLAKRIILLLILGIIVWAYEYSRALAATVRPDVHYTVPLEFEEKLFGEPLVVLFQSHRNIIFDGLFSFIYILHPTYLVLLFLILIFSKKELYIHSIISIGVASIFAIICYILCPVAPPWIAVPGITRMPNLFLIIFGRGHSIDPNPYAAMPSMHVATSIIIAYYLIRTAPGSKIVRYSSYSLIILMSIAVIYTGNHYILDIIGGVIVAYASLRTADFILRRRLRNSRY